MSISLGSRPFEPARCCAGPIEIVAFRDVTSLATGIEAQFQAYRLRLAEYGTLDKLYCHESRCRSFIPTPLRTARNGRCAMCKAKTCISCAQRHFGPCQPVQQRGKKPRPDNFALLMRLAGEQGWKRCPGCRTMVQRSYGCSHMICRCGFEFCYACGKGADETYHGNCGFL
ncbi:hypothetical protein GE09DRAFT_453946 [Coniochaeta sp. 2T2.1]|nr:hypothetical protein GE09DRAFT_453946 [Coniochaeta sp. 2T2.1]